MHHGGCFLAAASCHLEPALHTSPLSVGDAEREFTLLVKLQNSFNIECDPVFNLSV